MNILKILFVYAIVINFVYAGNDTQTPSEDNVASDHYLLSNDGDMITLPDGGHVESMMISDQQKAQDALEADNDKSNSNGDEYSSSQDNSVPSNSTSDNNSNTSSTASQNSDSDSDLTSDSNDDGGQYNNDQERYPGYPPYNPPEPPPTSQNYVETTIAAKDYKSPTFSYDQTKTIQFKFLNGFSVSQAYTGSITFATLKLCSDDAYSNCSQPINIGTNNTLTLTADILNKDNMFIGNTSSEVDTKFDIPIFYFTATDNNGNEYEFNVEIPSSDKSQMSCSLDKNLASCIMLKVAGNRQDIAPNIE